MGKMGPLFGSSEKKLPAGVVQAVLSLEFHQEAYVLTTTPSQFLQDTIPSPLSSNHFPPAGYSDADNE